jgi:hypothetical protein
MKNFLSSKVYPPLVALGFSGQRQAKMGFSDGEVGKLIKLPEDMLEFIVAKLLQNMNFLYTCFGMKVMVDCII